DDPGLARTGPGQDQEWSAAVGHRLALGRVERRQIHRVRREGTTLRQATGGFKGPAATHRTRRWAGYTPAMADDRLASLLAEIGAEFSRFRLVDKALSRLHRAIDRALRLI